MTTEDRLSLIKQWPKAELYLHIEGTLEPSMLLALADKRVQLPYQTLAEVEAAYHFEDLQSFLDLYYLGAGVLRDEHDFYELMLAYLEQCRREHIVHAEIMFDPQTHYREALVSAFHVRVFGVQESRNRVATEHTLVDVFFERQSEASALETLC